MNRIKYLIIHNSGGFASNPYASTQHHTLDNINETHRQRWPDFPSQIRFNNGTLCYIGYNFVITKEGHLFQARPVGAETAAQVGYNFDSISICLTGNFGLKNGRPIDIPTSEQIKKLQFLMELFIMNNENSYVTNAISILSDTKIEITIPNIHPHRFFGQTECYGSNLSNDWARKLVSQHLYQNNSLKQTLIEMQAKLIEIQNKIKLLTVKKLGSVDIGCSPQRG